MPKHPRLLALSTATLTLAGCLADVPADELEATSEASGEDTTGEAPEPDAGSSTPTTGEPEPADGPHLADERSCAPGEVETCAYGGPMRAEGVGTCAAAVRVCGDDGEWGACAGEVLPRTEDCRTLDDEDCDGRVVCDGKIEWVRAFGEVKDGEPGDAGAREVLVDRAGHSWVTGEYSRSLVFGEQVREVGDGWGVYVVELDGQSLPHYVFGDEQDGAAGRGVALADDDTGRVALGAMASGRTSVHEDGLSYMTFPGTASAVLGMMTTSGELTWGRGLIPTSPGFVSLSGLAFAPTGHLWAGGSATAATVGTDDRPLLFSTHGGYDAFLVKLAADGEVAWAGTFGQTGDQQIHDIAVDAAGDVWLTGSFTDAMYFDGGSLHAVDNDPHCGDMFVVKLDAAGRWKWGRSYGDAKRQYFSEIAVDDAGEAWLFGRYSGTVKNLGDKTMSGEGLAVAKMTERGQVLWARDWPCESCNITRAAVDGAGQGVVGMVVHQGATAIVNEQPFVNTGDENMGVVVKLDRAGLTVWAAGPFPGTGPVLDVGPRGEVVVAGDFREKVSFAAGAFHLDAGVDDEDIYVAHLRP